MTELLLSKFLYADDELKLVATKLQATVLKLPALPTTVRKALIEKESAIQIMMELKTSKWHFYKLAHHVIPGEGDKIRV